MSDERLCRRCASGFCDHDGPCYDCEMESHKAKPEVPDADARRRRRVEETS